MTMINLNYVCIKDIDDDEIWEDFVKMIADYVESHSISTFDITILLFTLAFRCELRNTKEDSDFSNSEQVI